MERTAEISIVKDGDSVTVICGGTLDLTNCVEFSDGLKQASQTAEAVVVDIQQVDFIDTQVVQDLARAAITLLKRDKRLKVITSKKKYPLRVIQISQFEGIMDVVVQE